MSCEKNRVVTTTLFLSLPVTYVGTALRQAQEDSYIQEVRRKLKYLRMC